MEREEVYTAAITKYHKPDSFKQRKFNVSHFWRLEVQNECIDRIVSF